jgi:predicted nucleic acid-binding protein
LYALVDSSDRRHNAAKAELDTLRRARSEPLLTNFVVAECHALLLTRLGAQLAKSWLMSNVWPVERVTPDDEAKASSIIVQCTDKTFSYTDATSLAVMERLGIRTAFAFDPHFRQYGFKVVGLAP